MPVNTQVQIAGLKFYFSPLSSLEAGILPMIDSWVDDDSEEFVLKAASVKRKIAEHTSDATESFFEAVKAVSSLKERHDDAKAVLEQLDADSVTQDQREHALTLLGELDKAEIALIEIADSLTPAQLEDIELVKFYRRKHENLTTQIGTHAMNGQLMSCYTVIKDVMGDNIKWPKFTPTTPARKVLDERMHIIEARTTPTERQKLLEAAAEAIKSGVAGLTDSEKKP